MKWFNGLLERKYSPGTARLLTPVQEEKLIEIITTHTPDEVGFPPRNNWNLSIIRELIKRNYEVEYSQSGLADALHRLVSLALLRFSCQIDNSTK